MIFKRLALPLFSLMLLLGCQNSAISTLILPTPGVTETATFIPTATNTPTPSPTPTPTPTPSSGSVAFISNRHGQFEVYLQEIDSGHLSLLTQDRLEKADLAWAPDRNWFAFAAKKANGHWQIYLEDLTGKTIPLTEGPADSRQPAWSPDGRRLAFVTNRDGNWEIYLVNRDGSGLVNLTRNPASDWHPTWSPDGQKIAFVSNRDGNWEIYVVDVNGNNLVNLTNSLAGEDFPVWSPTGELIAFISDAEGQWDVYLMNADGTGRRNLTHNPGYDGQPAWSPDGKYLVFTSKRDGNFELYQIRADGSDLKRLTRNPADDVYPVWVKPPEGGKGATPKKGRTPKQGGASKGELDYQPVTLWHFPADPRIDGMRAHILQTLGQVETGFLSQNRTIFGFEPGDDYQQIYIRDTSFILPTAQYFYPPIFLFSPVEEFLYRQYEDDTLSSDGDAGMRPGAGAISGVLCLGPSCVNKETVVSDEESSLIHAAYICYKAGGGADWLRKQIRGKTIIERLNWAMEWLYTHRLDNKWQLLKRGHTVDWGDVKVEPGGNPTDIAPGDQWTISIYDQAIAYRACQELAEMNRAVGDLANAERWAQRAAELRRYTNQYLWQAQRGFYRTHLHLEPVPHPIDEDAIISIANAVAVYTGLADELQAGAIFENLETARRSMGAIKPGLSLYPPYPSGFFAYHQMGEGMYQNGGLWDWWGGVQITAEFQHGRAQQALEHLMMVAKDWSTRPFGLPEWQFARTGEARGSLNYAASAGAMGEAIIAGLFGVHLNKDEVKLAPRLGFNDGYIRVYQPATDLYVAYRYTWKDKVATMEYGSNHTAPIQVRLLLPLNQPVATVALDGQAVAYTLERIGADTYLVLTAPPGRHQIIVTQQ
jgi:Tol biopolymer transport system component